MNKAWKILKKRSTLKKRRGKAQLAAVKFVAAKPEDVWLDFDANRKIRTINEKIIVIVPNDFKKIIVPLFCPLCEVPMKTREDALSYHKYECCEPCETKWKGSKFFKSGDRFNKIRKKPGWKEYAAMRVKQAMPLIKLK